MVKLMGCFHYALYNLFIDVHLSESSLNIFCKCVCVCACGLTFTGEVPAMEQWGTENMLMGSKSTNNLQVIPIIYIIVQKMDVKVDYVLMNKYFW